MNDFGQNEVGPLIQPCPLATPATWIEIAMVGEDGAPVPFLKYRVQLPNADVVLGFLDEHGCARIENISPAGQCLVSFPELDCDAWAPR